MANVPTVQVIYNDKGNPVCSARIHSCRSCGYRFLGHDKIVICPVCGENRQCLTEVEQSGERCRLHGGNSAIGFASGQWKHGRYSKHMPNRLLPDYMDAVRDKNLLALRHDIALVDTRMNDLIGRIDIGDSGSIWEKAKEEFRSFRVATAHNDGAAVRLHLNELDKLLDQGLQDFSIWQDIMRLLEHRRKLVETEMRRLDRLHQFMTAEEAQALMLAVGEAIKRHVKDTQVLGEISRDLGRLMATRSSGVPATDDIQADLELADILSVSEPGDGQDLPAP